MACLHCAVAHHRHQWWSDSLLLGNSTWRLHFAGLLLLWQKQHDYLPVLWWCPAAMLAVWCQLLPARLERCCGDEKTPPTSRVALPGACSSSDNTYFMCLKKSRFGKSVLPEWSVQQFTVLVQNEYWGREAECVTAEGPGGAWWLPRWGLHGCLLATTSALHFFSVFLGQLTC